MITLYNTLFSSFFPPFFLSFLFLHFLDLCWSLLGLFQQIMGMLIIKKSIFLIYAHNRSKLFENDLLLDRADGDHND